MPTTGGGHYSGSSWLKAASPVTTPATKAGEALIAYDLDPLFRSGKRLEGDLTYDRAQASRILFGATSVARMKPNDRQYLSHLVSAQTGIAQLKPITSRRGDCGRDARSQENAPKRIGFLLGTAAAWVASYLVDNNRDQTAPQRWNWSPRVERTR